LGDIPLKFIHENTNIIDNPDFLPRVLVDPITPYTPSAISPNSDFDFSNFDEEPSPF
jgi:hypothetical protein